MSEFIEINDDLTLVVPYVSDDEVSAGLRRLTRELAARGEQGGGGLLGGEDGYGVDFENDVFMMHSFCWCERDGCAWCVGCTCRDEQFHYFAADGTEVDFEAYYDLAREAQGETTFEGELCPYCRGEFVGAPNFLHKASGSRVKWYKYIGRSMEVELHADWTSILMDCLRSIGAVSEEPNDVRKIEAENAQLRRMVDIVKRLEVSDRLHRRSFRILDEDERPAYEAFDDIWIELRSLLSELETSETQDSP